MRRGRSQPTGGVRSVLTTRAAEPDQVGLSVAVVLGYLMYRRAIAFNLGRFFTYTGVALVIVAGGVLAYGIKEFQAIGLLPGQDSVAFDVSGTIAPDGFIGALLRGIFNLHPTTSWAQAIAWLLYVVPVMIHVLRPQRAADPTPKSATVPSGAGAGSEAPAAQLP